MEEEEYIQLQTLLAKLRVHCLKTIGISELDRKIRDENCRLIRNIDNLRNKAPLIIKEDDIGGGTKDEMHE